MASKMSKLLLLAVACISLSLLPDIAEAGRRTGTWRHWGPGWGYAYPGYYGGWGYPAYYGGPAYYGYYPPPYYRYRRHRSHAGAAFAAGLVGGMALGAIINTPNRGYSRCYIAPRRVAAASGGTYVRRVRVCR